MTRNSDSRSVQVLLEIGHRAWCKTKQTPDKTHEWVLFVRDGNGIDGIHHYVEKVVFYLHESFKKPVRVIKEPPFKIAESGYGIFMAKIEVFFRMENKDGQVFQVYHHDITLPQDGQPPIENTATEKITIRDVSEDFMNLVLKGGGTVIDDRNTSKPKDTEMKVKRSRKHQETIGSTPHNISPSNSRDSVVKEWEKSLFGDDVAVKKVRSEGTNSPPNTETNLKKKSNPDLLKANKRKSAATKLTKEVKSDSRLSLPALNRALLKPDASSRRISEQIETKLLNNPLHKDFIGNTQEGVADRKKGLPKPIEPHEEMSSDIFDTQGSESDNDLDKETSSNEEEQKLIAMSGLPYYELETIYSKVMSLNPEDNNELMMSYKVYKLLQTTGKGYDDDGICFDMHQLDFTVIQQIKDIMRCR